MARVAASRRLGCSEAEGVQRGSVAVGLVSEPGASLGVDSACSQHAEQEPSRDGRHWHVDVNDNDQLLEVVYRLPATASEGTYSFGAFVASRAFNPSGGDGGHLAAPAWQYDPVVSYIVPSVAFSVFNSN